MKFCETIRTLRRAKNLGQRDLADRVGVSFTYISKIENGRLDFGEVPSEELIVRLAQALEADADELLLLAEKIPERIKKRVLERPDVFSALADADDEALDRLVAGLGAGTVPDQPTKRSSRRKGVR